MVAQGKVVVLPGKPTLQKDVIWRQIMEQVSSLNVFADSKHFVDCPVKRSWDDVADDWAEVTSVGLTQELLKQFLDRNFGLPGSDLKAVLPPGWHETPPCWLVGVSDPDVRDLGAAVHGLWKTLCRQVCPTAVDRSDRHTLLPLPFPFIVPGDRFRECYNWDSYWIIRGLLACDLVPAAKQLLRNLLHLVDVWGFVPNGARTYYTNRSQPPLLSAMVMAVWSAEGDDSLLREALPRLVTQHRYWNVGKKAVQVRLCEPAEQERLGGGSYGQAAGCVPSGDREVFALSRYHAELYGPRPESFREDVELATAAGVSGQAAAALYCDVASAAESGWDFSSRWFVDGDGLKYTRTTQIVPVDLNAWLYRMERDIAAIAGHLGDTRLRDEYTAHAAARLRAVNTLMWSPADGCWHDLILRDSSSGTLPVVEAAPERHLGPDGAQCFTRQSQQDPTSAAASSARADAIGADCSTAAVHDVERRSGTYASNWVPLWCGFAEGGSPQAEAAVAGLRKSGLIQPGGLLTSLYQSGQQWDAPNAWPPLVHMAIEAVSASGVDGAAALADQMANNWLQANLSAWRATGHMHEKYNGYTPGCVGGGGEYVPQVGFGWSNGVLMALLQRKCACGH